MSNNQNNQLNNQLSEPVYKDFRGEIRRHELNGVKFNVLFTKAGALRSGDFHPNTQYDLILSGEVELTIKENDHDKKIIKGANELIAIPPNTPHLFRVISDSVMIEWWDGEFKAEYYEPYRKFVEEQFNSNKTDVKTSKTK